jgi:hypothetical protein
MTSGEKRLAYISLQAPDPTEGLEWVLSSRIAFQRGHGATQPPVLEILKTRKLHAQGFARLPMSLPAVASCVVQQLRAPRVSFSAGQLLPDLPEPRLGLA